VRIKIILKIENEYALAELFLDNYLFLDLRCPIQHIFFILSSQRRRFGISSRELKEEYHNSWPESLKRKHFSKETLHNPFAELITDTDNANLPISSISIKDVWNDLHVRSGSHATRRS
jgi:hypothetical protein